MVSRFIPEKQHSRLLDAFALQTDPRLHLMFVGDGGNIKADVLEKVARHPKRDRIHLLGERSDMPLVYPAMDLMVLPSDAEGMSNACLEAAACGVPTLANACCGSAELIEDGITGRISTMTTANALAVALSDAVMTPGQLRAWGDSARSHIVKNFSLQSMLDRYTQLYLDLGAKCGQSKSTDAS
jgi:glycosyltransferase involved in cell wall biosynthesis